MKKICPSSEGDLYKMYRIYRKIPDPYEGYQKAIMVCFFLISAQQIERKDSREAPPPDVVELCRETFQKTSEYLKGELEGSCNDPKFSDRHVLAVIGDQDQTAPERAI